jgi:CTD small phosphatase-like protein 2
VNIRPHTVEVLKELSALYEIIVFTASHSCYASVVLDYLDPKYEFIHHRLYRERCVQTQEGIYIKDLRVLANRELKDLLIVDNAAYSFGYQVENGIPILPFYDNREDTELLKLCEYLKHLSTVKDVREINKQVFQLEKYHSHTTPEEALEDIFGIKAATVLPPLVEEPNQEIRPLLKGT